MTPFERWKTANDNFMKAMQREYGPNARFYRFEQDKCTATPELAALYLVVAETYQEWVHHAIQGVSSSDNTQDINE